MTLELHRTDDPNRFLSEVRPFLQAHEDEHALLWGILGDLVRRSNADADAVRALLLRLERGGDTVGVALRAAPYNLLLGRTDPADAAELGRRLAARRAEGGVWALPGVNGPQEAVRAFSEAYREVAGGDARVVIAQRLFVANEVLPVRGALGHMRPAGSADRDLVAAWLHAFRAEALPHETADPARATAQAERYLPASDTRGIYLWEASNGTAAMARYLGPTPTGIRIAGVYTPPDKRGRGYATALVSALSIRLLERFDRCYLFTDLSNPASNSIYPRLGYEPVIDAESWSFEGA